MRLARGRGKERDERESRASGDTIVGRASAARRRVLCGEEDHPVAFGGRSPNCTTFLALHFHEHAAFERRQSWRQGVNQSAGGKLSPSRYNLRYKTGGIDRHPAGRRSDDRSIHVDALRGRVASISTSSSRPRSRGAFFARRVVGRIYVFAPRFHPRVVSSVSSALVLVFSSSLMRFISLSGTLVFGLHERARAAQLRAAHFVQCTIHHREPSSSMTSSTSSAVSRCLKEDAGNNLTRTYWRSGHERHDEQRERDPIHPRPRHGVHAPRARI